MTRQSWLVDRLFLMLLEDVRNGALRRDCETRCCKSSNSAHFSDRGHYRKLVIGGSGLLSTASRVTAKWIAQLTKMRQTHSWILARLN
jgi:hypothetical protein